MEVIDKLLANTKDLPASPQVLPKLLELLRNDGATLDDVGELIALEPAITAKLLQYCNSAYFRGAEPVSNVAEAIGRVGFQTIYVLVTIVTGGNLLALPAGSGLDVGRLWQHSLTSAFASKIVAEFKEFDINMLFTAGLLHDMGRVVLAKAKGPEYASLIQRVALSRTPLWNAEIETFGFSHADVGASLMEKWSLPEPLVESVRCHHLPSAANGAKQNAACICVGNSLAHVADDSPMAAEPDDSELAFACELLKIDNDQLIHLGEQMKETMGLVDTLLQN
jgi:putative nucleotidyltransferase with HDIG domain